MGLENLVLNVPSNIEAISKSIARWSHARVIRMKPPEIKQSKSLWRNSDRWQIIDKDGNILNNAGGYGFKAPYTAQKFIDSMNRKEVKNGF